ncbi:HD domain-containing protein [Fusobacterium sp.]|uniref:HD domain-containing protein n=1 Tax=Fusobacterium sp. TaxID=68766 RepID=UPI0028FF1E81|nr:HD domain-containing protein [Fusobacterium sp.]MDU1911927.1 HD domain-containing protein [Fusobacterium sp.]
MTDKLRPIKYINDPIYGAIGITELEMKIIDTSIFQRLRGLRQLARINYVFPGAEHSRYVHSLGVLHIMGLMTEHLLKRGDIDEEDAVKMRVAALLHDIGHYPFSHLGESVYSYCKDIDNGRNFLQMPLNENSEKLYELCSSHSKSAHHEHLGKYIVINHREISDILKENELDPLEIGEIFTGERGSRNMVYTQLLHSSLDADRLDYLLRDSYQTGVKYGMVDLQYLIRLLLITDSCEESGKNKILVCNKKGQHVIEHFLMSRYFHYSQVIFHKTNIAFEGMIKSMYIKLIQKKKFLFNSLEEIQENVNEDNFLNFNDSFLEVAFQNYYKEILDNKIPDEEYKELYEMYCKRIRPKVVFEVKDLYEEESSSKCAILKWILMKNPEKITEILKTDKWGYQIVPITIEKIQNHYTLTQKKENYEEDMREAIKLCEIDTKKISYLAEDKLSVIGKLVNYKSEFIRVYVLENREDSDYRDMRKKIEAIVTSN